ncbi:N-acylneuraminate-9-phosphatase [Aureococcus anophagefferens]|nr:N-acylneuraminate-9-phosphatase [Aureococcus anophagefferens]
MRLCFNAAAIRAVSFDVTGTLLFHKESIAKTYADAAVWARLDDPPTAEEPAGRAADAWAPDHFSFFASSSDLGVEKPDAGIFEAALERARFWCGADLAPHEVLHVGDSFECDYLGARAFGFQALHLDRSGNELVVKYNDWVLPGEFDEDEAKRCTITDLGAIVAYIDAGARGGIINPVLVEALHDHGPRRDRRLRRRGRVGVTQTLFSSKRRTITDLGAIVAYVDAGASW